MNRFNLALLLWKILRDERGIAPVVAGAAILGGSSLLGSIFGKKKQSTYDPYAGLRGDWQTWLRGKLGTSTPYEYDPAFALEQPPVEKAAESTILGRLGKLPTAEEYKGKVEASKAQQIAREKERAETQRLEEQEMYNRLGLVSSTPWMTRTGELGEESLGRQRDIETGMDIFGLGYGLEAERAMSDIGAQWTGLGGVLGAQQRGYQQWPMQMSMADIERMIAEEMGYGQLAGSILGGTPPQVSYTPNIWQNLGTTGQDIGSLMLLYGLLGQGKKAS